MTVGYSFQTGQKPTLHVLDYVLFSMLFVASAAIGFYHAWKGRNKSSVYEFHFAGRTLHPVPVSMSMAATFFSAVTILGIPAEVYTNNSMFLWSILANFIATIFVAHLYAPFFHKLRVTSLYEYVEKRFCRSLRLMVSTMFILQYTIYLGIVLYLPCLTLQAVTGVSLWYSMVVVAVIATLYTILGGMRSVVWVSTLQFITIVAGLMVALVGGANATGGIQNAWKIAQERKRIQFDEVSLDPRTRHSVWSLTIGYSLFQTYVFGLTQLQIQRVCTVSTPRKVTIAVWLGFPWYITVQALVCITGVVMFAFYSDCDPVRFGLINKTDQLIPLFVLDVMRELPGMPGLFLACVFSGCLGTISSCLNTISTVILEDFLKPYCCRKFATKHGLILCRLIVIFIACFVFIVAILASEMGTLIIQLTTVLQGMITGPLLGMFICGMFLPWTNSKGATVGLLVSLAVIMWLAIGAMVEKPSGRAPLPTNTTGCNWNVSVSHGYTAVPTTDNSSYTLPDATPDTLPSEEPILNNFYRISYMWYSTFGSLINILVTLVVSFVTGFTDPKTLDCRLICPLFDILFPWLPERLRRYLRFGVTHTNKYNDADVELSEKVMNDKEIEAQAASLMDIDS